MLNSFVFIYLQPSPLRQEILDFLDANSEIKNWYSFTPDAIVIISDASTLRLTEIIHNQYPNLHFLLDEVHDGQKQWLDGQEIFGIL